MNYHTSVLLQEVLDALQVQKGKKYIDATLGGAGHSLEIIKRGGRVLGIDQDSDAISFVNEKLRTENEELRTKLITAQGNFRDIDDIARKNGFEEVTGILFDLGVSSHQFEEKERGFSFQKSGPLDMRMDTSLSVSARDLVNGLSEKELVALFTKLGEEPRAKSIAKEIVRRRLESPIATTEDLVSVLESVYGHGFMSEKERARAGMRVFQALRIAVNDELNSLQEALPKAVGLLEKGGRLAVISFHSLEDRIVKHAFADFEQRDLGIIVTKKTDHGVRS